MRVLEFTVLGLAEVGGWADAWLQIEYMVVSFDDENKRALLSLRQTEILMKLQSVTLDPELEKYKPKKW